MVIYKHNFVDLALVVAFSVSAVIITEYSGFSLGHLHMGGICLPPSTSAGGRSINGGDEALMGGTKH